MHRAHPILAYYTINMPTYLNIPIKTVSEFPPVMGQTLLQVLP